MGLVRHRGEPGPAAVVPVASGYGGREGDVPAWLLAMPGILCPHMAIDSCFQNPTLHPTRTCMSMTLHAMGLYMYLPESHEHGQPLLAAFFGHSGSYGYEGKISKIDHWVSKPKP